MPGRSSIRVLHTADVHLGDAVDPQARMLGWKSVLRAASRADVLLVAGDLSDSPRVTPGLIHEVAATMADAEVPIVLLPGNHDLAGSGFVYERIAETRPGDHVVILDRPCGGWAQVPGLDLTVWGRGMTEHSPAHRPLAGHAAPALTRWHVAAAHGHLRDPADRVPRSSPMDAAEIAAVDCDYLALGHWHRFHAAWFGPVLAAYPGPPSPYRAGVRSWASLVTLRRGHRPALEQIAVVT
jgi:DNA repair exonuclease SbcCD nuclease subunit